MTKRVLIIGAIVAVLGLGGLLLSHRSSGSTVSSAELAAATATNKVEISNYMFVPMNIKIKVGTIVTWTNKDDVHHSVTADQIGATAPNGPLIGRGQSYSFKFTKAGTYSFHCMPHPYMHGEVIVTN